MANFSKISSRFECKRCGLGDFEVGHLVRPDEPFCLVCQEEDGKIVQLKRWEQPERAPTHPGTPPDAPLGFRCHDQRQAGLRAALRAL